MLGELIGILLDTYDFRMQIVLKFLKRTIRVFVVPDRRGSHSQDFRPTATFTCVIKIL